MDAYRALVCTSLADDAADLTRLQVQSLPMRAPEAGEVRVRVEAAGLNYPDVLMLRGGYQHRADPPYVVGMDFAGVVDAVGEGVAGLKPGDRVAGGARTGACAQIAYAPATSLHPVPEGMAFARAAAFPTTYLTAFVTLSELARLQPGETLLVHGASGGVGLAALDVGRLLGANVIAATGRRDKRARLEAMGWRVIGAEAGFRDEVKALTGGAGADVIVDPVGGEVFEESMRAIAFGGRLMVVGFTSGRAGELKTNHALIKGVSVIGVRAGEYSRRFPGRGAQALRTIWEWAGAGRVDPVVHAELPLVDAVEGLRALRDREVVGKIVVRPGE